MNTRAEEVDKKMAKSHDDLKKEVSHYERILSEFGLVNLKSLEIYDQAKSEYEELVTKRTLLDDEKVRAVLFELGAKFADVLRRDEHRSTAKLDTRR